VSSAGSVSRTLPRGRVLHVGSDGQPVPLDLDDTSTQLPMGRLVDRNVVDAHARAAAIVAAAEQRGAAILAAAEATLEGTRRDAVEAGRAEGLLQMASMLVARRANEADTDAQSLDRIISLARLLAERLLGHTLAIAPDEIIALCQQALTEARGARRVRFRTHPDDAPHLRAALEEPPVGGPSGPRLSHALEDVDVAEDDSVGRGDLRLETDLGLVDARLEPALERLAARLREALRS
jgi:flagellar biosynthesis/type III secretory pathway protein FliH